MSIFDCVNCLNHAHFVNLAVVVVQLYILMCTIAIWTNYLELMHADVFLLAKITGNVEDLMQGRVQALSLGRHEVGGHEEK